MGSTLEVRPPAGIACVVSACRGIPYRRSLADQFCKLPAGAEPELPRSVHNKQEVKTGEW